MIPSAVVRLFVGAEIDAPLRAALARALAGPGVRWVSDANLHLTLKFCGELPGPAPLAAELRREAGPLDPFDVEIAGLGRFPRVIWAGVRGATERLSSLAAACERAAATVGVPREDRPYSPHVTLGRLPTGRIEPALDQAIRAGRDRAFGRQRIAAVTIFRSRPGTAYEAIDRISLGSSGAAGPSIL